MFFKRLGFASSTKLEPESTVEADYQQPDVDPDEIEEIDLESAAGRLALLEEIENLALTCDVADNAEQFADSLVFELVAALQQALTEIEHAQICGDEITDAQASAVQGLYNQLAIEVEQPSIISVYVGPTRKDMVFEDLSEEGSITITQPEKAVVTPEVPKSFIHNSLPKRPTPTVTPKPVALTPKPTVFTPKQVVAAPTQEKPSFFKADSPEQALQKKIETIEAVEVSLLDSWIGDYQSPYRVLGDMPFMKLRQMATAPVNSRTYVEFKSLLELQKVKYEVFGQWSQQFAAMEQMVERTDTKSFKEVIDAYLTQSLAR